MEATKNPKLHDWQVLENIAPYLNLSDLIKTSTLSKEFNYSLRNYFKKHILPKNLLSPNTNQLSLAKQIFNRQIKTYKLEQKKSFCYTPNIIFKSLTVGSKYTMFETYQNQRIFINNADLLVKNNKQPLKVFKKLNNHRNYKFIQFVGDILYLGVDNRLIKNSLNQEGEQFIKEEANIAFQADISQLKISHTHLFVVTHNTFNQNRLFAVDLKTFKSVQVIYTIDKQYEHLDIDNLVMGWKTAYYIYKSKIYQLSLNQTQPKIFKSLKDKNFRRIINGARHFFAIQKMGKITQEWNTNDVVTWAAKEGYEDYVNIFQSEKVTGKSLLHMDKKYMEDVLGILNHKHQQRLLVQLEQNNTENEDNCAIWAWGRNDLGQLGVNPSNPISNPFKVKIPQGYNFLLCSNNTTLIHNPKTGVIQTNKTQGNKFQWLPILKQVHSLWQISLHKDTLMILCPIQKSRISSNLSQVPLSQKKQKLRTAKNIIDKISWDQNIQQKEFRVGYLDKYTGILEISFQELLKTVEIKDYRIQYFKRSGEVVWSKKDRVDVL